MSEILSDKNGKDYILVLQACIIPLNGGEIMRLKTKRDVFEYVVKLKTLGLLSFTDGKYFTTDGGKKLLEENK